VERGGWEIDEHRGGDVVGDARIIRTFEAPRQVVFDAFPVCEATQRWMGPPDRGRRKRPPTYASNPTIEMRDAAAR